MQAHKSPTAVSLRELHHSPIMASAQGDGTMFYEMFAGAFLGFMLGGLIYVFSCAILELSIERLRERATDVARAVAEAKYGTPQSERSILRRL